MTREIEFNKKQSEISQFRSILKVADHDNPYKSLDNKYFEARRQFVDDAKNVSTARTYLLKLKDSFKFSKDTSLYTFFQNNADRYNSFAYAYLMDYGIIRSIITKYSKKSKIIRYLSLQELDYIEIEPTY
jgi:hypothetical protein